MSDIDPAALAAKIAAGLRAGLEQDPHVVACTPGLIGIVATYLDAAALMIAAALERDALARDLIAAQARVAELEGERDRLREALEPFCFAGHPDAFDGAADGRMTSALICDSDVQAARVAANLQERLAGSEPRT